MFRQKPALHRYPGSMAKRTQALCQVIVDTYDGDPRKIWNRVRDPQVLLDRLRALPGYGDEKAKIFLAILGKRFGRAPAGWEQLATPFGDESPRSVADIDSPRGVRSSPRVEEGAEGQGTQQVRRVSPIATPAPADGASASARRAPSATPSASSAAPRPA